MWDLLRKHYIAVVICTATVTIAAGLSVVFFSNILVTAPNNYRSLDSMAAAVTYDLGPEKVFHVGNEVFYSGDESLKVGFDFSQDVNRINIYVVNEDGQVIESYKKQDVTGFDWKLNRNIKSYTLQFQFINNNEEKSAWKKIATVHDASRFNEQTNIRTHFDLQMLSAHVNFGLDDYKDKTVRLENDLILPNYTNNHNQIGNITNSSFSGTFDGGSHKISNINMAKKNTSLAFFNDFQGMLKDLDISGSIHIDGDNDNDDFTAAGFALTCTDATVYNFSSNMNVTVNSKSQAVRASGFFGEIRGKTTIINSTYSGAISSPGSVGAFAVTVDKNASFNLINTINEGIFTNPEKESIEIVNIEDYSTTMPPEQDPTRQYILKWINYDGEMQTTYEFYNAVPLLPSVSRIDDKEYYYEFTGWQTLNGEPPTKVNCDETYYATYSFTRKVYTLTWINYDGSQQTTQGYYNENPVMPVNPSKPNEDSYRFAFVGWNTDPKVITENTTYYAVYQKVINIKITVNYQENFPQENNPRGNKPSEQTVLYGDVLKIGTHTLQISGGYSVIGWSTDPTARWGDSTMLAGDALLSASDYLPGDTECIVTLYAIWAKNNPTLVTINLQVDEEVILARTVVSGIPMNISSINVPVINKTGFEFVGWSLIPNGELLAEQYTFSNSLILYAVYKEINENL